MPILEWDDSMAVGVYLIDEQHKELVVLINNIADAIQSGASVSEVSRFIRRFYNYTIVHFQTEESLMDHTSYPDYFAQVHEHLDCSMKALEFHRRFVEEDDFNLLEFLEYIVSWFRTHTTGIDQSLTEYVVRRGLTHLEKNGKA
ncbi:MAG: bacteriohemerythrin [Acidobacteriota bacterium]